MKNAVIKTFISVLVILSNVVFVSCKKNEVPAVIGVTEVSTYFLTPSNGDKIRLNSEISIEGRIDCKDLMSGWKISIKSKSTGEILDEYTDIYEQTFYTFHHHWLALQTGEFVITVEALDKDLNSLSQHSVIIEAV